LASQRFGRCFRAEARDGWERKTNPFVADLLFDDEETPD
jgi:hypothetical protein